jgi:hypothetical protein
MNALDLLCCRCARRNNEDWEDLYIEGASRQILRTAGRKRKLEYSLLENCLANGIRSTAYLIAIGANGSIIVV